MPKGRYLAEFELLVLAALEQLGDEAYGVNVRRFIEERSGRPASVGAVHATLGRLGDKGYVTFSVSDPMPVRGGRARKHAHITPAGRAALRHSVRSLNRVLRGLDLRVEGGGTR